MVVHVTLLTISVPITQAQKPCANSVKALCKRCASTVQAVCKQGHFVCKLGFRSMPTHCVYGEICVPNLRPSTPYIILKRESHLERYVFCESPLTRPTPDTSKRPRATPSRILPRPLLAPLAPSRTLPRLLLVPSISMHGVGCSRVLCHRAECTRALIL